MTSHSNFACGGAVVEEAIFQKLVIWGDPSVRYMDLGEFAERNMKDSREDLGKVGYYIYQQVPRKAVPIAC